MPLCALQAEAAALPEPAVALADHSADGWDVQQAVSLPSCLGCTMLACGALAQAVIL